MAKNPCLKCRRQAGTDRRWSQKRSDVQTSRRTSGRFEIKGVRKEKKKWHLVKKQLQRLGEEQVEDANVVGFYIITHLASVEKF